MSDYYRQKDNEYKAKGLRMQHHVDNEKEKLNTEVKECHQLRYKYIQTNFPDDASGPKSLLQKYAKRKVLPQPRYNSWEQRQFHRSIVTFNGTNYTSTYW